MSTSIEGKRLTGRHVAIMLAAFFGLMFAVNGVFVYFALGSFSGVSEKDAYKRGLSYNQEIDHHTRQLARNWHSEINFMQTGASQGTLTLDIRDKDGKALEDLRIVATIRRPVVDSTDQEASLLYGGEDYIADLTLGGPGQWDVSILAYGGGYEEPYRLDKRLWLK
ncbi:FixH family protein [uncultured Sneathiella sp.]|jgi:nitrogen fixation protein FixH|uniref:FixH family protein n=1 Tax=uncultured Sneathiella sp. TaxID=879315 RepID=UPI0030DAA78C|tara:strand:+ start:6519 stop:7016 length:498 start_codon:yes stop_codon:yes gene_type:complete